MALCTPAWDVTTSCALCTYCSAVGAAPTAVARPVSARKKRRTSCKGLPAAVLVVGVASWTGTGTSLQQGRGAGVRHQTRSSSDQSVSDACETVAGRGVQLNRYGRWPAAGQELASGGCYAAGAAKRFPCRSAAVGLSRWTRHLQRNSSR